MLPWIILNVPLMLIPAPPPAPCQLEVVPPFVLEERVVNDFHDRVRAYIRLHRRLERALPPETLFADPEDMTLAVDALHDALVMARPNVRTGTLFTPAVSDLIARRLEQALAVNGYTAAEVLSAINVGYLPGMPDPEVNGRFPRARDVAVWPALAAVLPRLPHELQYRFVDRHLVIVDMHADLVVDILTNALPAAETPIS